MILEPVYQKQCKTHWFWSQCIKNNVKHIDFGACIKNHCLCNLFYNFTGMANPATTTPTVGGDATVPATQGDTSAPTPNLVTSLRRCRVLRRSPQVRWLWLMVTFESYGGGGGKCQCGLCLLCRHLCTHSCPFPIISNNFQSCLIISFHFQPRATDNNNDNNNNNSNNNRTHNSSAHWSMFLHPWFNACFHSAISCVACAQWQSCSRPSLWEGSEWRGIRLGTFLN